MKRYGNLFEQIIDKENLSIAFDKAAANKKWRNSVANAYKRKDEIINEIYLSLKNKTYHTSEYVTKTIYEPKERLIYILPFAPDRVVHHAVMNILEPILDKKLIYDTYSCRKGKGQLRASNRCLSYCKKYKYCLQLDISKFYPSINHLRLKQILRCIFKDKDLLWLLDEIIDSTHTPTNVPIGNYLSQWFGNLYLNALDRFCIKAGFPKLIRYCDDLIIFSNSKEDLNIFRTKVIYLCKSLELKLSKATVIKTTKGIKFLGFRHFPKGYKLLKKSTAKRLKNRLTYLVKNYERGRTSYIKAQGQLASALGWFKHANTYNFMKKTKFPTLCKTFNICTERIITMNHLEDILEPEDRLGIVIPMSVLVNKPIVFLGSDLFTKKDTKYLRISYHLLNSNKKEPVLYVSFTKSEVLIKLFNKYKNKLPFDGMIIKVNNWYSLVPASWSSIMKGFPKHLNTKEDYEYIKAHFDESLWKPEFQKLLDSYKDWFFIKKLNVEADGINDETHKVVEFKESEDTPAYYHQYELQVNPNAKIFKLGYTVEEVENILK